MDFEEFHKETIVGRIRNDEDFTREINKVKEEVENTDREIDFVLDEVKEYYSFESIKSRFVDDLLSNPKPMISTMLQGIMAFRSFKNGRKTRRKK